MDWANSCIAYHDVTHQDDHAFVEEFELVEYMVRVWLRVCYINKIGALDDDECKLLEQVLMVVKVREREPRGEYHVDQHNLKPS